MWCIGRGVMATIIVERRDRAIRGGVLDRCGLPLTRRAARRRA
jgi:hypothetical protein